MVWVWGFDAGCGIQGSEVMCVRASVCACVRVCVRACVRVCACVWTHMGGRAAARRACKPRFQLAYSTLVLLHRCKNLTVCE